MTWLRLVATTAVALLMSVWVLPVAAAQSVDVAVDDLRDHDVTFEDDALTDADIDELDRVTASLQTEEGYVKVVVLGSPVDSFPSVRGYAEEVQRGLGGQGRVIVFDPQDVGVASSVPGDTDRISDAELAAIDAANRSNSYGDAVLAAAAVLGVTGSPAGSDGSNGSGSGGSGGGGVLLVVLMLAVVAVVGFLFYRWWAARRRAQAPLSPVSQSEGEQKVRDEVERTSNLVIELADRAELVDTPAAAKDAFRAGATAFAGLQDDLEAADTREELEAVYPRLVDARWKLEVAEALLEGRTAPPEPAPGPLFPPMPMPEPAPAGAPPAPRPAEPHYQQHRQHSPWLTTAAITAISVLASRGFGNANSTRRQPSDDIWFGQRYGSPGGSRSSGSRNQGASRTSRPRLSLGGSRRGRGMGRR